MAAISPALSGRIEIYRQRCWVIIDDDKLQQVSNNVGATSVGNYLSLVPPDYHVKILRSNYGVYSRFEK